MLAARIDRLPPEAKRLLQVAAVVGRDIALPLLEAVAELPAATLRRGLDHLRAAEFLYETRPLPEHTYTFKHALTMEAAYQSLLRSTRQQFHQRIAQVLAHRFPEIAETQPDRLAHHYTEARLPAQAVPYWLRAGQRTIERSTYTEAINHLSKGLELLKALPNTAEHVQQELSLLTILGPALIATKGQASPEVAHIYTRARELCEQVGDTPHLFTTLRGLWVFYLVREQLEVAHQLGEELLGLAQRSQDPALLLEAHRALGTSLFYLGKLAPALAHLKQGKTLYDLQQHRSLALRFGQDPGVACCGFAAWALWELGYPEQALRWSSDALALAQELSHPFSLAYALDFAARIHQLRREAPLTQQWAEALMDLARKQGFPQRLATGTILRGWALAMQGQGAQGMAQMQQGLAAFRATGAELAYPYYLALLGEGCQRSGEVKAGLPLLSEALTEVEHTRDRFYEAELYRLKGELLIQATRVGSLGAATDKLSNTAESDQPVL